MDLVSSECENQPASQFKPYHNFQEVSSHLPFTSSILESWSRRSPISAEALPGLSPEMSVAYKPIPGANGTAVAAPGAMPLLCTGSAFAIRRWLRFKRFEDSWQIREAVGFMRCQPSDLSAIRPDDGEVFRYRQQQSVNMGSWLQSAEIDIANGWGSPKNAQAVLERHWDTFITAADFHYLAGIGINTVRLPIGYWSSGRTYARTGVRGRAAVYGTRGRASCARSTRRGVRGWGARGLHGAVGSQKGSRIRGVGRADEFVSVRRIWTRRCGADGPGGAVGDCE
ncbi:hypothetical protein BJ912DRAFT_1050340 [Pholiota molesta]|nr:hypothetical protein BJ912DRAFT_1050340 [Pholiota molesta]